MIPTLWFLLFRTKWGLRTRAVGEHPSAAETVGISVIGMRYFNVIIGGGVAGLAGAYLAWGAALLFGYSSAIQTQFQFRDWLTNDPQFIGIIPFVVTIVVLAGFVGRARPPASIGQPYSRE